MIYGANRILPPSLRTFSLILIYIYINIKTITFMFCPSHLKFEVD